jgi:hypothetical protein
MEGPVVENVEERGEYIEKNAKEFVTMSKWWQYV